MNTEKRMARVDQALGRLLMRSFAVLAFIGAAGSTVFGAVVLANGHFPGLLLLLLAALFLWLGRRAWSDEATLVEVLSRDFEKVPTRKEKAQVRGGKH
jgi:hypothetical protein